ncbi:3'-phosphoadenosine 5'-phosphosulfate sulfotransferase [Rhodotorula kratochvilovae]
MTAAHQQTAAASLALAHPRRRFSLDDAKAVYALAGEDTRLGSKTKEALDIIHEALDTYGVDKLALSFNGGKDCTVLVHLLAAAILRHAFPAAFSPSTSTTAPSSSSKDAPPTSCALPPIPTVYIRCPSPFPQVEAFVALCTQWYHLSLVAIEGGMRPALQQYLDDAAPSPPQAILVGTRRGDPHGANLQPLQRTDSGWPDFVRVHPVLDWSYADIWAFLRCDALSLGAGGEGEVEHGGGLEWCELYDYGYTSLGSTHNTFPNPLLRATATGPGAGAGEDADSAAAHQPLGGWRPAWELEDEGAERAGRCVPFLRSPSVLVLLSASSRGGRVLPTPRERPS